jgi:hypothetical protein
MEEIQRQINNQQKHIDNIMKELALYRPVVQIYSNRNVLSVFAIVVSVTTLILLFLKG